MAPEFDQDPTLEEMTEMDGAILYIDRSEIRAGRAEEVKAAIRSLVALVEPAEPQLLAYTFYLDERAGRMTVVAVHPDADSMELHMAVGAPGFERFAGLIDLRSVDVYGRPGARAREQLAEKARMLGGSARVTIHEQWAGFTRPGLVTRPR